ncbi:hypothetical protein HHI36_009735 [Cryptolaemus montrouzieri]|uniref:Uncharacterized protein n=1 Tax=Cryptolaemus montrouzieri TaxID=559131 RepID=A0ABD2MGQ4_9CUCU
MLWRLAQKHLFCTGKTFELAPHFSNILVNEGYKLLIQLMEGMDIVIGPQARAARDDVRVQNAEVAHTAESKEGGYHEGWTDWTRMQVSKRVTMSSNKKLYNSCNNEDVKPIHKQLFEKDSESESDREDKETTSPIHYEVEEEASDPVH